MTQIDKILEIFNANTLNTAEYIGEVEEVCGRVMLVRGMGKKLTFLTIQDSTGRVQIAITGPCDLKMWDIARFTNMKLKCTKTGERTCWTQEYQALTRCLERVPDKLHGVVDTGTRYARRYLELVHDRQNFVERSKMIRDIRLHMECLGFVEVDTPALEAAPCGATAKPFKTHLDALDIPLHLRIATEVALKKLLVGGFDRVYEIGKIFRNEGIDATHNPEFTSMEAYCAYTDLSYMQNLMMNLCEMFHICHKNEWLTVEYDDVVKQHGPDFDEHLIRPTFVVGQPLAQTPLCKARADGKAERFEAFINGMEIANAFTELNDPEEQAERLKGQPFIDDDFLMSLRYGMPPASGIGIGIDRLAMVYLGKESIRDVILFPFRRMSNYRLGETL